jgi:hypothetical protein
MIAVRLSAASLLGALADHDRELSDTHHRGLARAARHIRRRAGRTQNRRLNGKAKFRRLSLWLRSSAKKSARSADDAVEGASAACHRALWFAPAEPKHGRLLRASLHCPCEKLASLD